MINFYKLLRPNYQIKTAIVSKTAAEYSLGNLSLKLLFMTEQGDDSFDKDRAKSDETMGLSTVIYTKFT